jgi:hypothetical protein
MPANRNARRSHGAQLNRVSRNEQSHNWVCRLRLGVSRIWHEGHRQPSHRRNLQQCRLHRICTCVELAAHIDTARNSLVAEWLAVGAGAAQSKNSSTLLTDVCGSGARPRIANRPIQSAAKLPARDEARRIAASIAKLPELVSKA